MVVFEKEWIVIIELEETDCRIYRFVSIAVCGGNPQTHALKEKGYGNCHGNCLAEITVVENPIKARDFDGWKGTPAWRIETV